MRDVGGATYPPLRKGSTGEGEGGPSRGQGRGSCGPRVGVAGLARVVWLWRGGARIAEDTRLSRSGSGIPSFC